MLIDSLNKLILLDQNFEIPMHRMLPLIQDTIIQAYLQLTDLQYQELVLQQIMILCKGIIVYLKKWNGKHM